MLLLGIKANGIARCAEFGVRHEVLLSLSAPIAPISPISARRPSTENQNHSRAGEKAPYSVTNILRAHSSRGEIRRVRHRKPFDTSSKHEATFLVDIKCGIVDTLPMNNSTQYDPAAEGLDLSDPRHQLIYALRRRLVALHGADPAVLDQSTSDAQSENTLPAAGTAEYQPLSAETQPECSRNTAGMQPEYSGHSAGTDGSPSLPENPSTGASSCSNRKRPITESPLDELPAETQAEILRLLDSLTLDAATVEITATQPYGLGVATSRSSLYRFHQRHTRAKKIKIREHDAAETARLIAEAKSAGDLSHTATHLIAIRLLETALIENSNPSDLLALSKAIDRLRAVEHSERRLRIAEAAAKTKSRPHVPEDEPII